MSSPYTMQGIPANLVPRFWDFAEPFIKRALDHTSGEFSHDDLKQLCLDHSIQLWLIYKEGRIFGAGTTEIVVYPQRKHCRIITLAGSDFDGWIDMAEANLLTWAKEQGCTAIEAYVRRGFMKRLQSIGYKQKHVILTKEI